MTDLVIAGTETVRITVTCRIVTYLIATTHWLDCHRYDDVYPGDGTAPWRL